MKKLGKFLIAGALAAVACVGLVACGGNSGYKGEYKYANTYSETEAYYGAKVTVSIEDVTETGKNLLTGKDVTVITGGKITKITVAADTDNYHNITPSWKEGDHAGDLGYDKTLAGLEEYLNKFVGKTVAEVMAINVEVDSSKAPVAGQTYGSLSWTGATQTSGRIILAVQNALGGDETSVMMGVMKGEKPEKGTWAYHYLEKNCKTAGMSIDEYIEAMKGLGDLGGIGGITG